MKKSWQYMALQCVFIARNKYQLRQCRCGRNVSAMLTCWVDTCLEHAATAGNKKLLVIASVKVQLKTLS